MQRLPQQALSLGFVPVAALPSDANRHQQLALGTELHHRVAVLVADPHVVVGVDRHPVRLVLMADDVVAEGADQLVVLIELEQLRLASGVALEGVEMSLRIDCDRGDAAAALGQRERIRIGEPQIRLPQFVADDVALETPGADRRLPARLRAAVALNRLGPSAAAGGRLLRANARERDEERDTENHQDIACHVSLLGDRRYAWIASCRVDRTRIRRWIISVSQPGMAGNCAPLWPRLEPVAREVRHGLLLPAAGLQSAP